MPVPAQLQQLLHNRTFQIAGVAVAGVGGYVLYQRRKGGSGASSSELSAAGGQTVGTPTMDTTAGDVANWLSNYDQNVNTELQDTLKQFLQGIDQLKNVPAQPVGAPPPITSLPVTPHPIVRPPKKTGTGPIYVTVTKYTKTNTVWSSTLSGIASHYHTSVPALMKLNPNIKNPNAIRAGQRVRVK